MAVWNVHCSKLCIIKKHQKCAQHRTVLSTHVWLPKFSMWRTAPSNQHHPFTPASPVRHSHYPAARDQILESSQTYFLENLPEGFWPPRTETLATRRTPHLYRQAPTHTRTRTTRGGPMSTISSAFSSFLRHVSCRALQSFQGRAGDACAFWPLVGR